MEKAPRALNNKWKGPLWLGTINEKGSYGSKDQIQRAPELLSIWTP